MTRSATNAPAPRALATPQDLSEFLGVPELTLQQWRVRGSGPPFSKPGRGVRYRWADVEAWLDGLTRNAPEAEAPAPRRRAAGVRKHAGGSAGRRGEEVRRT